MMPASPAGDQQQASMSFTNNTKSKMMMRQKNYGATTTQGKHTTAADSEDVGVHGRGAVNDENTAPGGAGAAKHSMMQQQPQPMSEEVRTPLPPMNV